MDKYWSKIAYQINELNPAYEKDIWFHTTYNIVSDPGFSTCFDIPINPNTTIESVYEIQGIQSLLE